MEAVRQFAGHRLDSLFADDRRLPSHHRLNPAALWEVLHLLQSQMGLYGHASRLRRRQRVEGK